MVVGLSGGLGNQLFQYAAGRALAHRLGVALKVDLSWFHFNPERRFMLEKFKLKLDYQESKSRLPQAYAELASRISRRFLPKIGGLKVWREPHFHFCAAYNKITKPVFIDGYWQSEKYFTDIKELLFNEMVLKDSMPPECFGYRDSIAQTDAICVHIRRGDYINKAANAKLYHLCSTEYYNSALERIKHNLSKPHCFVFSDDKHWVKSNIKFDCATTIVELDNTDSTHFEFSLMTSCKHFIIANSSFSWWAAWLSKNHSKQIVAPKYWFLSPKYDERDLLPSSWIKLEN